MLRAVSTMEPVRLPGEQVSVWLACGDHSVGCGWMAGLEGRGYSGECGGVEKRKDGGGLGLSAAGCCVGI